jgi:hypothetical protein
MPDKCGISCRCPHKWQGVVVGSPTINLYQIKSRHKPRNGLCLLEYRSQPGHEPPPHIHLDQDEAFYLLEGELEVYCMGQVVTTYALADPALAIATGKKHGIKILTPAETAELLPHYPGFGVQPY